MTIEQKMNKYREQYKDLFLFIKFQEGYSKEGLENLKWKLDNNVSIIYEQYLYALVSKENEI